jgi:hypothetical protein
MIMLTLYSRPDCHLCEAMHEELAPLLPGRGQVSVVDISGDAELERRYGLRIPVLTAGDEELSFYRLDRSRVERYLSGTT